MEQPDGEGLSYALDTGNDSIRQSTRDPDSSQLRATHECLGGLVFGAEEQVDSQYFPGILN